MQTLGHVVVVGGGIAGVSAAYYLAVSRHCDRVSLLEAEALLRLLEEFPGKSAWISFSCRNGREVAHGEPFAECAALADGADALLMGRGEEGVRLTLR